MKTIGQLFSSFIMIFLLTHRDYLHIVIAQTSITLIIQFQNMATILQLAHFT